jgi:hypothetical protein
MVKATTSTLAAALLAASCGLAMAQAAGGAGADKTPGSEAGRGRPTLLQSPMATSSPESNKMQERKVYLGQKAARAKMRRHAR